MRGTMFTALVAAFLIVAITGAAPAAATAPATKTAPATATAATTAEPPATDSRGEYGVMLAMSGQPERAESLFVSMLSNTRGDARALNNLGNLRVLRGEPAVGLAFYDRALQGDSADAGIHLNRATALMLMGDDARAQAAAARGVQLAGGLEHAQRVLGLKADTPAAGKTAATSRVATQVATKAADKALVTRDEVRSMLQRAAAAVPKDTARTTAPPLPAGRKKSPTWRSAGPRASDLSDAATVLYWKK